MIRELFDIACVSAFVAALLLGAGLLGGLI